MTLSATCTSSGWQHGSLSLDIVPYAAAWLDGKIFNSIYLSYDKRRGVVMSALLRVAIRHKLAANEAGVVSDSAVFANDGK